MDDQDIYTLGESHQADATTPEWTKHAIWYQIMVDRFRNGDTDNDPTRTMKCGQSWYQASPWEGRDGQSFYEWYVFDRMCGGDLRGLCDKLDHLARLGVNAIYLNPIFQAESCHKYNATSYLHVDDRYGFAEEYSPAEEAEDLLDPQTWRWTRSDLLFLDFLKEAKARGFRVIIDGVFNHVGTAHPAFRDVLRKGRESRFADWFDVRNWDPFEYEGWAGFGGLPAFKKNDDGIECQAVKDHIFAITRRWMDPDGDGDPSDGIDGWRLDVPNEIALPFWIEWCAEVRSINPEAYISGEIWDRAEEWLDGRSFDAVMNYEFAKVLFDWIGAKNEKITASRADQRLAELRRAYPSEITYSLQNLIDSHDTDRAVSKIHNPDRPYDSGNREQDDPQYDGGRPSNAAYRRLRLLVLFQMTYVGAPMIYYGDEVGMWGSDDPNNRKPMPWDDLEPNDDPENRVMPELFESYARMIGLRREHEALRIGSFETVCTDDRMDVWMYRRIHEDEEILVAINAGENVAQLSMPNGTWRSIHDEEGMDENQLAPLSGRAWKRV